MGSTDPESTALLGRPLRATCNLSVRGLTLNCWARGQVAMIEFLRSHSADARDATIDTLLQHLGTEPIAD